MTGHRQPDLLQTFDEAIDAAYAEQETRTCRSWPGSRSEREFLGLMRDRRIEETVPRDLIKDACLLCSEHPPDNCHRRLVAEYLRDRWGGVEIKHLL